MLLSCPICMSCFDQAADMFCLPCGHIYHMACALQWFQRTQSCPQCRKPTTESKCIRLYPQVANINTQQESPGQLLESIDSLKLEINSLKKEQTELRSSNSDKEMQISRLCAAKEEIAEQLVRAQSNVCLLKDKVKSLKNIQTDLAEMRQLKEKAETELKMVKNIQRVLDGSLSDAQEALLEAAGNRDLSSILTLSNTLKKELVNAKAQKNHLKRTLDQEKARHKSALAELSEAHKKEVAELNRHLAEVERELVLLQTKRPPTTPSRFDGPTCSKKSRPADEVLVQPLIDLDEWRQDDLPLGLPPSQTSTTSSLSSDASSKVRVLKPKNTNKVKLPLQKNAGIFGASRLNSSTNLLQRMYEKAANPPDGMTFDGMGRTVRAEVGFKQAAARSKLKFK